MKTHTQIELKKVYKLLKNSIEDLIKLYRDRYYDVDDENIIRDLIKLKKMHPEYNLLAATLSQPANPDANTFVALDPNNDELRYLSEVELLRLMQNDIKDTRILDILGLSSWDRTELDTLYLLGTCPGGNA